jgi:hypothetical protein
MAIQNLDNVDSISNSTLFAVNQNGLDYNCTGLAVANFIEQNISLNDNSVIQYSAPLTGSTVAVSGTGDSVWLVLTPASNIATLTVQLPLVDGCVANQEILILTTRTISSLTINLNGALGSGIPSGLVAGSALRLRFEPVLKTWYNVTGLSFISSSSDWNPGTIGIGGVLGLNVTVPGVALGDFVEASFSLSLQDITLQAYVSAVDTVRAVLVNTIGVAKTLGAGTLRLKITK